MKKIALRLAVTAFAATAALAFTPTPTSLDALPNLRRADQEPQQGLAARAVAMLRVVNEAAVGLPDPAAGRLLVLEDALLGLLLPETADEARLASR